MTSLPPSPQYPPPGQGGGWGGGPAGPGYGGPVPGVKTAYPLWPIILVTFFFSLFGLIPTVLASNRASERRESPSRYWVAFVVTFVGAVVVYVVVVLVLVFVVFASAAVAIGGAVAALPGLSTTSTFSTGAAAAPGTRTDGPCGYTQVDTSQNPYLVDVPLPPDPDPTPTGTRTWTLVTSAGTVTVRLDAGTAPCTVQSIAYLSGLGFYVGAICPRVAHKDGAHFLQCGDPFGQRLGGPSYTSPDEDLAGARYPAGTVAMATSGPDTNGSQFSIVTTDSDLPGSTVIGTVTKGLDVVSKIVASNTDSVFGAGDGAPMPPVSVISATVS